MELSAHRGEKTPGTVRTIFAHFDAMLDWRGEFERFIVTDRQMASLRRWARTKTEPLYYKGRPVVATPKPERPAPQQMYFQR